MTKTRNPTRNGPQLVLDPARKPGEYARAQAEAARREWFESRCREDADTKQGQARSDELWDIFRRAEAGANAEETVGRFLDLIPGWLAGVEVYHNVEFGGRGLPGGDIDHLVVVRDLEFALAVETKFRLYNGERHEHRERIKERAVAVEGVTRWWTYPVLCQAAAALTDDPDEYIILRHFEDQGRVLVADATNVAAAIGWVIRDFDAFSEGEPVVSEHR